MAEIAEDHQSVIAEQAAENVYCLPTNQVQRKQQSNNVDWSAYFERNRKSCDPSIKARAAKIRKGCE
jgi:hypothetical protein